MGGYKRKITLYGKEEAMDFCVKRVNVEAEMEK